MPHTALARYLARHAEPAARRIAGDRIAGGKDARYARALVIPMFDEEPSSLARATRNVAGADTLIIAVVNAPSDAQPAPLARTRRLLQALSETAAENVLVIDCASSGAQLAASRGVGLARKLGSDVALHLYAMGRLDSPWLYQTDADAELPADYFDARMPTGGAVVFDHEHVSADPRLQRAAELYDQHMRLYVAGLAAAGSPYAYPSLGSTIAVHADAYAAVRGYPRRNAAEDFYLLNKVAKVAGVSYQSATRVRLQARLSHRVPFGTGPALARIVEELERDPSGASFSSYHPAAFELLAAALQHLTLFAEQPRPAPRRIAELLGHLRFDRVQGQISSKYAEAARRRDVLNDWFDAGKTLRFVRAAARYHPDQPLRQTLAALPESIATQYRREQ